MKNQKRFFTFLSFVAATLLACVAGTPASFAGQRILLHSAARAPQESAKHAFGRYVSRLRAVDAQLPPSGQSVLDSAKPLSQLDFSSVPQWQQRPLQQLLSVFQYVRDLRFVPWSGHQNFPRRSTWLYPDDGCFARAALVNQNLEKHKFVRPGKLFAFGDLKVKTPNAPGGSVSWWYHVVPIVRVGQNVFVFDPAIEPDHPLTPKEWFAKMADSPQNLTASVCDSYAYAPSSPCFESDPRNASDTNAINDQMNYLDSEWARIQDLGRDPQRELGDSPPWAHRQ